MSVNDGWFGNRMCGRGPMVAARLASDTLNTRRGGDPPSRGSWLTKRKEVRVVAAFLILAFLVLIGPLSIFFGVDSRRSTDRGWVGAAR